MNITTLTGAGRRHASGPDQTSGQSYEHSHMDIYLCIRMALIYYIKHSNRHKLCRYIT